MANGIAAAFPSLTPVFRGVGRFFSWWGTELTGLVPDRIRLWWKESDRVVLLQQEGERLSLLRPAGDALVDIYSFQADDRELSKHRPEVAKRLLQTVGSNYSLLLCLPPAKVFRRTVSLPLAVEENLRQALTYELDRYTPFKPEQAYFDCRISQRNVEKRQLSVELVVAAKALVDQAQIQATALGLNADGAVLAEDALRHRYSFINLLPVSCRKPHLPPIGLGWRLAIGTLATILLAIFLAVPIWQKRMAAIALIEPLAKARSAAKEADAARERLGKLVEEHDFLPAKKWASHSASKMLDELSKLIPDDTFVTQLEFDGKTVQIQGETASSATLVQTIEASPVFKDVSFKSQLTKIQGTANDRFHLGATLETPEKQKPEAPSSPSANINPPPNSTPAAATSPVGKP